MSAGELPPALLARATRYRLDGRVHFPKECIGDVSLTSFPLNVMKRRAVPGSVSFEIVPK